MHIVYLSTSFQFKQTFYCSQEPNKYTFHADYDSYETQRKTSLNAGTELKIFAIFVKSESGKSSWSLSNPEFNGFGFDDGFVIFPIVPKLRNFLLRFVNTGSCYK